MPTYYFTNRAANPDGTFVEPADPQPFVRVYAAPNNVDTANVKNYRRIADSLLGADTPRRLAAILARHAVDAAGDDPAHLPTLVLYIHGFNNTPDSALGAMTQVADGLRKNGVVPVMACFDWASNHEIWEYLTDQGDALRSVPAIIQLIQFLYQWRDPKGCRVNINLVVHSMGAYVLEQGLKVFARSLGNPENHPYLNEVLLVASDIDSDALSQGGDGTGITSLARRVTVYFSRWDNTLGLSALLKHHGNARLGRNGPSNLAALPSNVVAVDCTDVIQPLAKPGDIIGRCIDTLAAVHSSYWANERWRLDAAQTLMGYDRAVQAKTTRSPLKGPDGSLFALTES